MQKGIYHSGGNVPSAHSRTKPPLEKSITCRPAGSISTGFPGPANISPGCLNFHSHSVSAHPLGVTGYYKKSVPQVIQRLSLYNNSTF